MGDYIHNDNRVSVTRSSNVQIGNSNTMEVTTGIEPDVIEKFVTEIASHLDELKLDSRRRQNAEAAITIVKNALADDADPSVVKPALRTLRNITEGAIGSLIATAAQPDVWRWLHQISQNF